jgi:hypothetical protein
VQNVIHTSPGDNGAFASDINYQRIPTGEYIVRTTATATDGTSINTSITANILAIQDC